MPSSLTRFHSRAWVYSTHPPVSVCGTGALVYIRGFLGCRFTESALAVASTSPCGTQMFNTVLSSSTTRPDLNVGGAGILNLLAIVYTFRSRLRPRLTLGGRTFPRKPWVYGDPGISPGLSLLMSAFSLVETPRVASAPASMPRQRSPTNDDRRIGHHSRASVCD